MFTLIPTLPTLPHTIAVKFYKVADQLLVTPKKKNIVPSLKGMKQMM